MKPAFHVMYNEEDDTLNIYQYRLLGHYRRVCGKGGECFETTRTTAERIGISPSTIVRVRRQLADMGKIILTTTGQRVHVKLPETAKLFLQDNGTVSVEAQVEAQTVLPQKQTVATVARSVIPQKQTVTPQKQFSEGSSLYVRAREEPIKKEPIKNIKDKEIPLPAKNGQRTAATTPSSKAVSEKPKEPRTPRPGDAEYDAIKAAFPNAAKGEILMLRGLLCGIGTVKGDWKVNQLDTPLTPEEVIAFGQYRTERARRGNISAPSKPDVLARWVNDWRSGEPLPASTMAKNATTAAPVPAVIPETQTEKFKREQAVALQLALQRQAREDEAREQAQAGKVAS